MRVISTPFTGSSLARLVTSGEASPWFVDRPRSREAWLERASLIRRSLLRDDWLSALGPALGSAGPARERLERAAVSGFVVTSGQQPGLFGGPLYTWWKALSALALADELENLTGLPVAPVFWAATDDSDFAESSSTIVATQLGAEEIRMPEPPGTGVALAKVRLPDLEAELAKLEAAGGSASSSAILRAVHESYRASNTIGGAYVQLLRTILHPLGISVIDAAHESVRATAHPLLIQSLQKAGRIEEMLTARSSDLKSAGHAAQVKLVEGRTLTFAESDGKRDRVRIRDAASVASSAQPGTLGPNVLLRPVVERSILPTVAYIGGPAEVAYFAQVTAVADALEVIAPLVVPRWSGFVIEPRVEKILERYDLSVEDFRDPHAVETRLAVESIPPQVAGKLTELKTSLEEIVSSVASSEGADLVPPNVLQGLSRNVSHRIERLQRRFAASIKRRGNEALRDAAIARGALFPFGAPQERKLNIIPLIARYGDELLQTVLKEIRQHASNLV